MGKIKAKYAKKALKSFFPQIYTHNINSLEHL